MLVVGVGGEVIDGIWEVCVGAYGAVQADAWDCYLEVELWKGADPWCW